MRRCDLIILSGASFKAPDADIESMTISMIPALMSLAYMVEMWRPGQDVENFIFIFQRRAVLFQLHC